jgi:hypothetical protein
LRDELKIHARAEVDSHAVPELSRVLGKKFYSGMPSAELAAIWGFIVDLA